MKSFIYNPQYFMHNFRTSGELLEVHQEMKGKIEKVSYHNFKNKNSHKIFLT